LRLSSLVHPPAQHSPARSRKAGKDALHVAALNCEVIKTEGLNGRGERI